jgi:hypothetical protein
MYLEVTACSKFHLLLLKTCFTWIKIRWNLNLLCCQRITFQYAVKLCYIISCISELAIVSCFSNKMFGVITCMKCKKVYVTFRKGNLNFGIISKFILIFHRSPANLSVSSAPWCTKSTFWIVQEFKMYSRHLNSDRLLATISLRTCSNSTSRNWWQFISSFDPIALLENFKNTVDPNFSHQRVMLYMHFRQNCVWYELQSLFKTDEFVVSFEKVDCVFCNLLMCRCKLYDLNNFSIKAIFHCWPHKNEQFYSRFLYL